jgi:hypothetical protein
MSTANRKPPSLSLGLGLGLVLAISGGAVLAALGPLTGAAAALRAVVALLGFAYVLYVLGTSGERVGRISTVALWLVVSGAAWLANVPIVGYVLIHLALVWLVRSLYSYSSVLSAAADLALSMLGLAFAVWAASRTGSATLAFWCFFLAQAFHVLVPASMTRDGERARADDDARFIRAERAAEAALRRLSTGD